MTTLFTMTINTGSKSQGETQRAETELVADCLQRIAQKIGSSQAQSGNVLDRNGANVGSFTYTPVASH